MSAWESSSKAKSGSELPSQVRGVLDEELLRLEGLKARAWQVLAGVMLAAGTVASVTVAHRPLVDALVFAIVLFAIFTFLRARIAAKKATRVDTSIAFGVELVAASFLMFLIARGAGPHDALVGFGPPLFHAGIAVLTLLRLDWRRSLVQGIAGGVGYILVALAYVRPMFDDAALGVQDHFVGTIIARGIFVGFTGLVGAFAASSLSSAFGRTVKKARARDLFGKYRLDTPIAQGGMGVVHRATYCPEGGFRRPVAVKLIHEHLARDPKFVDGFRNEAELCARLLHHNIVQVLDFGRVDDTYFIAMELVEGTTVRSIFKRTIASHANGGRVPEEIVGAIGHAILGGLHHAHREALDDEGKPLHVIHRDLGLENILVAHTGVVKVTDFGIARALREANSAETQTVVGHSDHMAPEQANAEPLDERCDLFCVGILLWELLCGRPLFTRAHEAASLLAVITAPIPPPSTIDASLARWDAFFAKALARPKEERFPSAKDMAHALGAIVDAADAAAIARYIASLPPEGASSSSNATEKLRDTSATSATGATGATSETGAVGAASTNASLVERPSFVQETTTTRIDGA